MDLAGVGVYPYPHAVGDQAGGVRVGAPARNRPDASAQLGRLEVEIEE